jgi:hypothetical protein
MESDEQIYDPSRRSVLGMFLGATLLAQSEPSLAGDDTDRKPRQSREQPAQNLDASHLLTFMKMNASSADAFVPWYYTGRIYAAQEATAPQHWFDFEGTEIYSVHRTGATDWAMLSSTLTFFRDRHTGAYLETFDNPITGLSTAVKPNRLSSPSDRPTRISTRGLSISEAETIPWNLNLQSNGGVTWLTSSRYITKAPQPWIEVQSMFAPTSQVDDALIASTASTFVSTYLAPWLGWMNMKDVPGHMVWHAAGRKLASLDELPATYRKRADGVSLEHFQRR